MMDKETGGKAFPSAAGEGFYMQGMTLRDYFAAKAMNALLGSCEIKSMEAVRDLMKASYGIADTMLAERAK